jgi:hypothetical protein
VDNITTQLDSLVINDKNEKKLLAIPTMIIKDTSLDLNSRQFIIGDFSSHDSELHLVRQKDGIVIMKELLRPREKQEKKPDAVEAEITSPWSVTLKKGGIKQYSIVLEDHTFAAPTTILIDKFQLNAENFSTVENSKGLVDLGMRIDKKGIVSIKGPITIAPLTVSLALDVAELQVKNLQPYFADKVALANSDGTVSLNGEIIVSKVKGQEITSSFRGNGGIADFSTYDTVAGEEFLKWKDLRFEGMEYDSDRFTFRVKEIGWHDFYNYIVVFDDGVVNVKTVMKESGEQVKEVPEKSAPEEVGKSLLVEIESVKLENGKIEILDRNITPNYASSLSELSGTIKNLSSQTDVMSEVNISGKLDQHAPLLITGIVNPLGDELFADLVFDFRDIELSPTSPYTGKFIGYTVAKGKLSLEMKYLVEGTKITGENKAFLDQFTLGETVESPDAMNLPVNLAISLLKNRKGEITLNVPVKGDLDDPVFSVGGVVFKVIINLIAKAATSPFALLGALIPDGEDLQYVDFTSGSSVIEGENAKKAETIAKVLYDRPGLKMDLKGSVNTDQESPVLHQKKFEQLLKNEKSKELSKKKKPSSPVDEITIDSEEYKTFLKKAYKKASFEKPKNALGFNKKLPPEEMEKLLRENIIITDDDLRLLAIQRANAVKSLLVEAGPVEPERLFVIEPETGADQNTSQRVEMIIK